ncbi:hypothetical protein G7Y89_g14788 [Cudoniella acicularis]|uniref:J domain-containing protein n=1 Tax=Cudoniella acicularis TaxID=354080 RepID=A0A8H4QYB0_9HELO|nr:hypothetical protein G7Y89_g14788 [Cudoniella acicularis]
MSGEVGLNSNKGPGEESDKKSDKERGRNSDNPSKKNSKGSEYERSQKSGKEIGTPREGDQSDDITEQEGTLLGKTTKRNTINRKQTREEESEEDESLVEHTKATRYTKDLEENYSEIEVKKAYKKLLLLTYPDKNKYKDAEKAFKMISIAYQVLGNSLERASSLIESKIESANKEIIELNKQYNREAKEYNRKGKGLKRKRYVKEDEFFIRPSSKKKGKGKEREGPSSSKRENKESDAEMTDIVNRRLNRECIRQVFGKTDTDNEIVDFYEDIGETLPWLIKPKILFKSKKKLLTSGSEVKRWLKLRRHAESDDESDSDSDSDSSSIFVLAKKKGKRHVRDGESSDDDNSSGDESGDGYKQSRMLRTKRNSKTKKTKPIGSDNQGDIFASII